MIMKKYSIEFKWGILFILTMLVWMFGERLFGLHDERIEQHAFYTNFFAIVAIAVYLLALWDKRKHYYHGFMTWKQGFISGLILTFIITILTPLAQYISNTWIAPDYFPNMIEYSVRTGEQSLEEAEAFFNLNNYILQSTVFALISGVITSAIAALIIRRKPKAPTSETPDLTGI
jgi:hypothetical protein